MGEGIFRVGGISQSDLRLKNTKQFFDDQLTNFNFPLRLEHTKQTPDAESPDRMRRFAK